MKKKQKNKRQLDDHVSNFAFIILFMVTHVFISYLNETLHTILVGNILQVDGVIIASTLTWRNIIGAYLLLPALLYSGQSILVKIKYRWSIHKWLIASFLGAIINTIFVYFDIMINPKFSIFTIVFTLLTPILQAVVIKYHVKHAWLWIVGHWVIMYLPQLTFASPVLTESIFDLISGFILASILVILHHQTKQSKEMQVEVVESNQQLRIQRLSKLRSEGGSYISNAQNISGNKRIDLQEVNPVGKK